MSLAKTMGGHVTQPRMCQLFMLLLVVVLLSFVGQVSSRGLGRVVQGITSEEVKENDLHVRQRREASSAAKDPVNEVNKRKKRGASDMTTNITEATEGEGRKRRAVTDPPPQQFLCPSLYRGITFQCLSSCQDYNAWRVAVCPQNQVCCRVATPTRPPVQVPLRSGPVDYYSLAHQQLIQLLKPEAVDTINTYTPTMRCGAKSPIRCLYQGRIGSGNEDAETCFGEWPWHVAILEKQRHKCNKPTLSNYQRLRLRCHIIHPVDLYRYICGGSLISANHVLTAAHCIKGVRQNRLKLHLGDYNLYSSDRELLPEIQRSVTEAYIHEGYDPYTFEDDIAVLILEKPVDLRLTPHISPVCLPSAHQEFSDNAHCTVVGWGEDPYKPNHGSNILKKIDVTIGSEEECEEKLGQSFTLGRHQLCIVGNLGMDACLGDGGGAVVCPVKADANYDRHFRGTSSAQDQYFIVGIISWGSEDCGEDSVTVINMVNPYLAWIGIKTSPRQQYEGVGQGGVYYPDGSRPTTNCRHNQYFQRVETYGYGSTTGYQMTRADLICVFGEKYTVHPRYKLWYDSVYGAGAGTSPGTGSTVSVACKQNPFKQRIDAGGYVAITGLSLSLEDIKCVFTEQFTANPNYRIWYNSVHGTATIGSVGTGGLGTGSVVPSEGTGTVVSSGATVSCQNNPFKQKVDLGGYTAIDGMSLSTVDILCVFGDQFNTNPNYPAWLASGGQVTGAVVPSVTASCQNNPFVQKVQVGGVTAINGMSLQLEDIKCVFGEQFTANADYGIWYNSVLGTGAAGSVGTGGLGTGTVVPPEGTGTIVSSQVTLSCLNNPFKQKVDIGGYTAINGMSLTTVDILCVFGDQFNTNPNYPTWLASGGQVIAVPSCKENKFFKKIVQHGYQAITGAIMTVEDLKCVFGEQVTNHSKYNPWFVSVYCVPSATTTRHHDACCLGENFNALVCCGEGRQNPAKCTLAIN